MIHQLIRKVHTTFRVDGLYGFKSRGFGLTQSQLHSPGKLNCLILVMAIALYWAVSTGLWAVTNTVHKKTVKNLL